MSIRSRMLLMLAVLLVMFGAGLDSQCPAADNCDTDCHIRRWFYACGPPCIEFQFPTCLYCPGNANYRWTPGTDTNTNCTRGSGPVVFYWWSNCDPLCDCTGNLATEATNVTGTRTMMDSVPIYACTV
jgi:hypothetical protein